jgi:predicted transcriptional regulator
VFKITAKCLGVSRLSVSQYKDGSNVTKIQRKRLTKSSTDVNTNIKKEIRLAIYQMYNDSKTVVTLLLIDGKQQFVEFMQNVL